MEEATEIDAQKIATEAVVAAPEDAEARFAQLEEEKENYRKAYLKEAAKNKPNEEFVEDEDEKTRRIAREVLAESRLAEINREQDVIIKKALKENKELKLAHSNKDKTPPAAMGTSQETIAVQDSTLSPDQLAYFRSKGWDDKKIAQYKKNLAKRS